MPRPRLSRARLLGLDRSGPPPPQTQAGQPLRPWTIPNAIGFARLALIPVFLIVALSSAHGPEALAATLFALIGLGDYADGIAARVTRQYSRLGALMDPVTDRLLVICGVVVTWRFDLLPRWALAILAAREALLLVVGPFWVRRGHDLQITMLGRWAVWPTMAAIGFGLCGVPAPGRILLYVGIAMTLGATVQYARQVSTSA